MSRIVLTKENDLLTEIIESFEMIEELRRRKNYWRANYWCGKLHSEMDFFEELFGYENNIIQDISARLEKWGY